MFPLQRSNQLEIPFSNSVRHQQHKISEDLIFDDCDSLVLDFSDKKLASSSSSSRPKRLLYEAAAGKSHTNSSSEEFKKKKMVHREIERQRRQEMATLHASLRSLLPLHFIKGKRSLSDQMNQVVNYINHLQKNIKELSDKKDELKKLSNLRRKSRNNDHASTSFTIHQSDGAVGIEITSGFKEEEGLPLSKLLELLLEEGLEVVCCISTKVNGRLLHSVQCEVSNNAYHVDLTELRRKISNVIQSFACFD